MIDVGEAPYLTNAESTVLKVTRRGTGARYVAKYVEDCERTREELRITLACTASGHPNIMPLECVYANELPVGHSLRPLATNLKKRAEPVRVLIFVSRRLQSDLIAFIEMRFRQHLRLAFEDWASLLNQMTRAVEHVHACGFVHADVKPENFLVDCEEDIMFAPISTFRVLLMDFGHAGAVGSILTHDNFGTPIYNAPEVFVSHDAKRLHGQHHPLHIGYDVWALGMSAGLMANVGVKPMPFLFADKKTVQVDQQNPAIWAALDREITQRDETDMHGLKMFLFSALQWNPAARPDATALARLLPQ